MDINSCPAVDKEIDFTKKNGMDRYTGLKKRKKCDIINMQFNKTDPFQNF
jgi:hypothetical protein